MSSFTFFHRPEVRKYNYKPQFYNPDKLDEKEGKPSDKEVSSSYEFANRMHDNWSRRRQHKNQKQSSFKYIIWLVFIALILGILYYKFFIDFDFTK